MAWTIRQARPADAETIVALAHALDRAEGKPEGPITAQDVLQTGFGEDAAFRAVIAEEDDVALGFATYQRRYDIEQAARGLYVGDLYVEPAARRRGIGRALMAAIARVCLEDGGRYLSWNAMEDNAEALAFYRRIGGVIEPVATLCLQPDVLRQLAESRS
jgi:GNAT superfamily N-acetyltransferase